MNTARVPARPSITAAIEPASPPPTIATSVSRVSRIEAASVYHSCVRRLNEALYSSAAKAVQITTRCLGDLVNRARSHRSRAWNLQLSAPGWSEISITKQNRMSEHNLPLTLLAREGEARPIAEDRASFDPGSRSADCELARRSPALEPIDTSASVTHRAPRGPRQRGAGMGGVPAHGRMHGLPDIRMAGQVAAARWQSPRHAPRDRARSRCARRAPVHAAACDRDARSVQAASPGSARSCATTTRR